MKVVILAGGMGSRLSEETVIRPKPLVEVGGKPILWHIMKIYSTYGINDFVICLGYKGNLIKEYFSNYLLAHSDVTFDIAGGKMELHQSAAEPWQVTLVDTGDDSGTGGRLKRIMPYVEDDEAFCMTYGDGVGNIDIGALIDFHKAHGKMATVTATRPLPRFGVMHLDHDVVSKFEEKPHGKDDWINGGFYVLSSQVFQFIEDDATYWERAPLAQLVEQGELQAYRHDGFWRPMDTLSDKVTLDDLWTTDQAPWKTW
jgi:glucose-1-phosphate cytidylyltransferase